MSNTFLVKDNKIITPNLTQGILPGITREVVLELARKNNIPTEEREVKLEELFTTDECFLTNSLMEIMPLVKIDKIMISNGCPGTITQLLHKQYQELILK